MEESVAEQPPQAGGLLERDAQLSVVQELLERAAGGRGSIAAIVGGPGEGKSTLLAHACSTAASLGIEVWRARGSHLEREFAFGAVRQLLEPAVHALDAEQRSGLMDGAAGLAAGALDLDGADPPAPSLPATHGLYWLLAGFAERRPLLLALDDAHWIDRASLEWLSYLCGRLEGLPVIALLATRSPRGDDGAGPLASLLGDPAVSEIGVAALCEESVMTLLAGALDAAPEPGFAAACHSITGGNPFAVREMVGELARRGIAPNAGAVAGLAGWAPDSLKRNVKARLARLQPAAGAVARSLAVLGDRAVLCQLAALAGIDVGEAATATEAIAGEGLLREGPAPSLQFAHPLLRSAVYDAIPPRVCARMHHEAATLLHRDHGEPEAIAAHLLRSDPAGSASSVAVLRDAADVARRRGDASAAVTYLRRALAEPARDPERGPLLADLGAAELTLRSPAAAGRLRSAIEHSPDLATRARLRKLLAEALLFEGEWDPALALLRQGREEAQRAQEADLALRMDGRLTSLSTLDARGSGIDERDLARLIALGESSQLAGARPLRLNLALLLAVRGREPRRTAKLLERGLDGGRFLEQEGADAIEAAHVAFTLVVLERLDDALAFTEAMLADAARRGSVLGFVAGSTFRAVAHLRAGALPEAEADCSGTLQIAETQGLLFTIPFTASYLALTVHELGREEEALKLIEPVPLPGPLSGTPAGLTLLQVRGRLRRACGRAEEAIADLRACGEVCGALGVVNPNVSAWRSELALALGESDPVHAGELVAEELALARAAGAPRAVGVALLAAAALPPSAPQPREALLEEAVQTLRGSPARLELARALVDLGAHVRRQGSRTAARGPLKEGLELAHRCGATPLQARAREELLAAGARPRRPWLTGVESLTASELRVASMAADGRANREIAQMLFVTTPTVKGHLSSIYRKLGIATREQLTDALAGERP